MSVRFRYRVPHPALIYTLIYALIYALINEPLSAPRDPPGTRAFLRDVLGWERR